MLVKEHCSCVRPARKTGQGFANARTSTLSSRKTCPAVYTERANETSQGKLAEKTCSLYTRASTATKELAKENLVVCTGLRRLAAVYTRDPLKIRPGIHAFVRLEKLHLLATKLGKSFNYFYCQILDPQFLNALLLYIVKGLNKHWLVKIVWQRARKQFHLAHPSCSLFKDS